MATSKLLAKSKSLPKSESHIFDFDLDFDLDYDLDFEKGIPLEWVETTTASNAVTLKSYEVNVDIIK